MEHLTVFTELFKSPLLSLVFRILSDWLEVKLGGGKESEASEEQLDGTLQTLCVINKLQEKEQRLHKVHISVKVRSDLKLKILAL